jgi:hypothetical protein
MWPKIGRILLKTLIWAVVLAIGVIIWAVLSDGGPFPSWVWWIGGLILANYVIASISEWGQEVLATLRDIRARLPDYH